MTDQEAFEAWMSSEGFGRGLAKSSANIWHAALAYLRSQQEPVGVTRIGKEPHNYGLLDIEWLKIVPQGTSLYLAPQPAIPDGYRLVPVAIIRVKSGYWIDTPQSATANLADGLHHLYAAPQPAIPDGWKLVPVEPTQEMLEAAYQELGVYDEYRAMLAAAPEYKK